MAKSIYQSEIMLNMNTRLFLNALEGVTDEQAKQYTLKNVFGDWVPLIK